MSNLSFTIRFDVPAKIIYNALTDQQFNFIIDFNLIFREVSQYTRGPAIVEPKLGGKYSVLDGRITGEFKQLIEGKFIEMNWKMNDWDKWSVVKISIEQGDDFCDVKVEQAQIPKQAGDVRKLELGWRQHIFESMSKIRGYPINNDND